MKHLINFQRTVTNTTNTASIGIHTYSNSICHIHIIILEQLYATNNSRLVLIIPHNILSYIYIIC